MYVVHTERIGWGDNRIDWCSVCKATQPSDSDVPPKFDIVDEIEKYIYHGYVAATAVQTSHY